MVIMQAAVMMLVQVPGGLHHLLHTALAPVVKTVLDVTCVSSFLAAMSILICHVLSISLRATKQIMTCKYLLPRLW